MVEFEIPDKWINNTLKVGGGIIILLMVATLIRPSVTGNVVNRLSILNDDLMLCYNELNETSALLLSSDQAIEILSDDISDMTGSLYECSDNLNATNYELESLSDMYDSLADELNLVTLDYEMLSSDYESLLSDYNRSTLGYIELGKFAAEKWCCINRIVSNNPDIDSYDILTRDNEILCRESGRGTYELTC